MVSQSKSLFMDTRRIIIDYTMIERTTEKQSHLFHEIEVLQTKDLSDHRRLRSPFEY